MKRGLAFAIAIALCGAIVGFPPAEAAGVDLRVCVLVLDAADLTPLPESSVVLLPVRADDAPSRAAVSVPPGEPSIRMTTDTEGAACFDRLPPGHYLPEVSRPGFWSTRSEPFRFPPEPCEIPSETPERLDVRIGLAARWSPDGDHSRDGSESVSATSTPRRPSRRLRIAILDEDKAALPGVTVALTPVSDAGPESDQAWIPYRGPPPEASDAITGVTRNRGGFCFDDLPAGRYRLRTQLDGFWETEVGPIEVSPSAFEQEKLTIALELTWATRAELKHTVILSEGWPDLVVEHPAPRPDDCP